MNNETTFNFLVTTIRSYYDSLGVPYPTTGVQYKCNYPKGFSSAVICTTYKEKLREILDSINMVAPPAPKPTSLEEAISITNKWHLDTGGTIPKTQREWNSLKYSDGLVPFPAQVATKYGFSILEVIKATSGLSSRKTPEKVDITEVASKVGVTLIDITSNNGTYSCNVCGHVETTSRVSLRGREARGLTGCYERCNVISGKTKDLEYYRQFIDTSIYTLTKVEAQKCFLVHGPCGNTIKRDIRYITRSSREGLVCEYCDTKAIRTSGYSSLTEKSIIEFTSKRFPELTFDREVMYKHLVDTTRLYRADLYCKELNLVLEITSESNKFEGYANNLAEKLALLHSVGINAFKVTSKKQVEDIVSSLLKGKEV